MGSYYKKYANVNYFLRLASYAIEIFFRYPILEWIDRVQNSSCWVNRTPAGLPQENQTVLSVENFIKDLPKSARLIPISARLIPMWNWYLKTITTKHQFTLCFTCLIFVQFFLVILQFQSLEKFRKIFKV